MYMYYISHTHIYIYIDITELQTMIMVVNACKRKQSPRVQEAEGKVHEMHAKLKEVAQNDNKDVCKPELGSAYTKKHPKAQKYWMKWLRCQFSM